MLINGKRLRVTAFRDITERKKTEKLLQEQKKTLEQKNIALSEILGQIEIEKKQIKDNVIANAENLLLPIIQKLRLKGESSKYVQLLQKNLKELTSSFGSRLTEKRANLSTREIEICNMIKNGLTNKEIARLLNISLGTTEKHRNNIRKKFDIINKDINLSSFLNTL
jgi:DNA-binding CsgD family transcriptional regulator